ncbi:MAG: metallophosphoesterase [Bacteroidales bacterium]|nr:metallophosphoesterase [Bacteroidales bacterium]
MHKTFTFLCTMLLPLFMAAQHRADLQELSDPSSSTMVILGDPQGYVKYDINCGILEICTAWIADNVSNLNIKAVLCTGDMVEQNDNNALDRRMLNQSSREMWESVSHAFRSIDGKIPYIISGGNHDYGFRASEDYHTFLPDYFTFERQGPAIRDCLVSESPNREGRASLENSAYEFSLPGWERKFLIITTEFTPSDKTVEWAKGLCLSEKYREHNVIFMTHSYMKDMGKCKNVLVRQEKYGLCRIEGNNSGEQLWEKLISQVPNIRLVLCGHIAHGTDKSTGKDRYDWNVGWRTDRNSSGKDVHQMMFNVQTLGGGWEGNGGDGWLRILEFMPDGKTVKVRTYSPLFGISPLTRHLAHRTETYDQFDFTIDQ